VSEVNILRELKHPNITRYYDRVIDKEQARLYIVMEYCAGGDLAALIKRQKALLREARSKGQEPCQSIFIPEEMGWKLLAQLTLALLECHNRKEGNKILHRDLKPGNVFLDAEDNVKLGDFGLSRIMGDQSVFAQTHVGTPYYMSPEQIQEQRYNEKSDIWSAGCVIYEALALRAPFEATNQIQLAYKIKLGKIDRIP
jgi:NIMA (never in mitosis gene a)-related kinase 2